jgi:amino acid adenylation domain-containing protein
LTGQTDLVVGIPVAGQAALDNDTLIGHFVNTLPLRSRMDGAAPFADHLRAARQHLLEAHEHQALTFGALIRRLNLPRDPSRTPLVSVIFNVDRAGGLPSFGDLTVEPVAPPRQFVNFEIFLDITDTGKALSLECNYNADLFDAATIRRWLGHYRVMLEAIARDASVAAERLPLLDAVERECVVSQWNATAWDDPADCVHRLFERQVLRTPASIALAFEGQTLTYADLNRRANQLAHALRGRGVGAEMLVGVCMERSIEMVVALLGVLKAGAAYVPFDPTYPPDRLAFMVDDAGASVLLTQERLLDRLPAMRARIVCVDGEADVLARESAANPDVSLSVDALAYVIYTSGSTGRPKGVMNSHRGIANRLRWMARTGLMTEHDRVVQKTPFSFDVSVWELFAPLLVGGRLVVARPEGHRDPKYLADLVRDEQITTIHFVPSMLHAFLDEPGLERCRSVRRVVCSGEALPLELQERFYQRMSGDLYNLYGPTEAAVEVTSWRCPKMDGRGAIIGHPIANTQIYLLDRQLQPLPIGVAGELHIGGIQVARGYWRRPDLTAERFVPDPFSATPGARLYKTGDLARYLPDGAIEYLGRLDDQVKIRGFRIELGEIESVLRRVAAVRDCAVIAEAGINRRIVAYVVADADADAVSTEIRDRLRAQLPDYMVPSAFVFLDALPLSPSGKLDRRRLPAVESSAPASRDRTPARTETEHAIADIWREALDVDELGVHDSFFDLGGHSMLAIKIVSKARERFAIDLPVTSLFHAPTIARLAQTIDALLLSGRGPGRRAGREVIEL